MKKEQVTLAQTAQRIINFHHKSPQKAEESSITMDYTWMAGGTCVVIFTALLIYVLYCRNLEDEFDTVLSPEALALINESDKKKKGKQNKKDKKKQKNSPDGTEDEREKREAVTPTQQKPATLTVQTNLQSTSPSAKKVSPAAKPQQPSPSPVVVTPQEEVQKQQLSPQQQEAAPQKKKSPKPVNIKDLDQKKVLARLSNVSELDEAYVQWLTSQFRDTDVQKNGLTSEVKALQKKLSEASQKYERLQKEKASCEAREKNEQSQRASLSAKVQALQARDSELSRQIQAVTAQLSAKDADHTKDSQALRAKSQQLETELNNLRSQSSRTAGQLRSAQQQAKDIQGKLDEQARNHKVHLEASEAGSTKMKESITHLTNIVEMAEQRLETASNEISDQTSRIRALASENQKLKEEALKQEDTLNATRLALNNQAKHDSEKKDSELEVLKEEKKVWLSEKEQMVEKYERLEELVKELNNDIAEFHSCYSKRDQEKIVADLRVKDKDRSEELTQEKEKQAKLVEQVNEARQMLAEVRQALDEEKARAVEIPLNTPAPEVQEEVFELKKTNVDLAAAPSTSSDESGKVKELQEKNDELRQRNMSILEKVEATPNLLVSDRKRVVAELAKVTKKQFKNFNDEEAYYDYLEEAVGAIEKTLAEKIQAASAASAAKSPAKTSKPEAQCSSASSDEAAHLRRTIVDLRQQLEHIGELAEKQNKQLESLQS